MVMPKAAKTAVEMAVYSDLHLAAKMAALMDAMMAASKEHLKVLTKVYLTAVYWENLMVVSMDLRLVDPLDESKAGRTAHCWGEYSDAVTAAWMDGM